ncbi:MAG: phosphatidylserine/phosphatidylglycerophosphate/cardiolipin synthase family protein [Verrucomicrobia bacterium]|nr:phosphatidylserine/phosphatidylglycerophosphate/cardiolipin synthase family protein [Verrucomicrobiota bacterium]
MHRPQPTHSPPRTRPSAPGGARPWHGGRQGRWAGALAAAACLLAGASLPAATPAGKSRTVEQLQNAGVWAEPRAFVRGNNVRIYYALDGRPTVFKAEWQRARIEGRDYTYRLAELEYDQSPPRLPRPDGLWHEATVLGQAEWEQWARDAAEWLTGPAPWQGTFLQLLDTERVLYRDETGATRVAAPDAVPARVAIRQRYNAQEFATTLSRLFETSLGSPAARQRFFVLVDAQAARILRFILLDTAKRRCVLLYAPRVAYDPQGGPQILTSARMVTSFLLESHGVALLKNPVSALGRLLNVTLRGVMGLLDTGLPSFKTPPPPVADRPGMDLEAWEARLDGLGAARDRGALRLLVNGEQFFPAFQRRVAQARRGVDILVCIFDRDDIAVDIADFLKARSADVPVRVILDRMNSHGAGNTPPATPMRGQFVPPASIGAYLERDSQVRVRPFLNPWFTSEHAKLYLVDGDHAYLGGMNLGREYRHEWHDLMVEVTGPVVAHFQHDFAKAWAHAGLLGDLAYATQALFGPRPTPPPASDGNWPMLRRLYTRTGRPQIRRAVLDALDRARQRVYMENPYPYDNRIVGALARARHRGVDVRMVLPSSADFTGADRSNCVTANYLLKHGVRVFVYPGMTHVKALLVDGWACLGSANFNRLSMQFNHELNLATSHPPTVESLRRELFEVDFAKSREIRQPIRVSWTDHVAEYILNHF